MGKATRWTPRKLDNNKKYLKNYISYSDRKTFYLLLHCEKCNKTLDDLEWIAEFGKKQVYCFNCYANLPWLRWINWEEIKTRTRLKLKVAYWKMRRIIHCLSL